MEPTLPDIRLKRQIKSKASRGLVWTFSSNMIVKIGLFAKSIVIARVLFPEDLGILGVALLVSGIIEVFSRTGFEEAIVQKRDDPEGYLDSVWTFNLIRGFVLLLLTLLAAPAAGWVFKDPRVVPVVMVIAANFVFTSAANPAVVLQRRNLKMLQWNIYRGSGPAAEVIFGIIAIVLLKNVWGLVIGVIANGLFSTVVSFLVAKRLPKIHLNLHKIGDLFGFGKHILGSGILIYLITQGDNIVVGRVTGIAALGLYKLAYGFANVPVTAVTHVLSDVLFPAYSRLQDDKRAVVRVFETALETSLSVALPFAIITAAFSPYLIQVIFGDKWVGASGALSVLCFFMLLRTVGANAGPLANGLGQPDIVLKASFAKLVAMAVIIYPLTKTYGIVGAALATTIPSVFHIAWILNKIIRICDWNWRGLIASVTAPIVGGLAVVAVVLTIKFGIAVELSSPVILAGAIVASVSAYVTGFTVVNGLRKRSILQVWIGLAKSSVKG